MSSRRGAGPLRGITSPSCAVAAAGLAALAHARGVECARMTCNARGQSFTRRRARGRWSAPGGCGRRRDVAVISTPEVSRTRATLRRAEFGFLGVSCRHACRHRGAEGTLSAASWTCLFGLSSFADELGDRGHALPQVVWTAGGLRTGPSGQKTRSNGFSMLVAQKGWQQRVSRPAGCPRRRGTRCSSSAQAPARGYWRRCVLAVAARRGAEPAGVDGRSKGRC